MIAHRSVEDSKSPDYIFYTGETYFDAVSTAIDTLEKGEVSISTMGFDPEDSKVSKVLSALQNAAKRGIDVSLTVDNFTTLDKTKVGLIGTHASALDKNSPLDILGKLGIQVGYSNYPLIGRFYHGLPSGVYSGRSHIKSAVVGEELYVGGISLDATDRLDGMVSFANPQLAANVASLNRLSAVSSVRHVLADKDHVISFDKSNRAELRVDAGIRGQSAIFEEALSIVDEAKETLIYASEQFPNGKVGSHLLAAYERGVDVRIAVNHPNSHDRYRLAHKIILDVAKRKYPSTFFDYKLPEGASTLHTKALASESRAMIGSHNLNAIGVRLGTAEMDVVSSDPGFVNGVTNLITDQMTLKR